MTNKQSIEFDFDSGMSLYGFVLHYNCYRKEFTAIPRDQINEYNMKFL